MSVNERDLNKRIRLRTLQGATQMEGVMRTYIPGPAVMVVSDSGQMQWWRSDLADVVEEDGWIDPGPNAAPDCLAAGCNWGDPSSPECECNRADLCHCGRPVTYGFDGDPSHHRGMCAECDAMRCDAYPMECPYPRGERKP